MWLFLTCTGCVHHSKRTAFAFWLTCHLICEPYPLVQDCVITVSPMYRIVPLTWKPCTYQEEFHAWLCIVQWQWVYVICVVQDVFDLMVCNCHCLFSVRHDVCATTYLLPFYVYAFIRRCIVSWLWLFTLSECPCNVSTAGDTDK